MTTGYGQPPNAEMDDMLVALLGHSVRRGWVLVVAGALVGSQLTVGRQQHGLHPGS